MKKRTTADIPPSVASEYDRAPRRTAVSEAIGDGYTKTEKLQKVRAGSTTGASKGQYGLPKSGKRSVVRM
jgi:hypothetical protein